MLKPVLRMIRWILGKIIGALNALFPPRATSRSPEEQARIQSKLRNLSLYQFEFCPFCVKVRRAMKRMNIQIELRDAKQNPKFAEELVQGGGSLQVPCLRIAESNGSIRWMYESSDIIQYLESQLEG